MENRGRRFSDRRKLPFSAGPKAEKVGAFLLLLEKGGESGEGEKEDDERWSVV